MGWDLAQGTCRENQGNRVESSLCSGNQMPKSATSAKGVGSSPWKTGRHPVSKTGPGGRSEGPEEEPGLAFLRPGSGRAPASPTPSTVVGIGGLATQPLASCSQIPLSGLEHGTTALPPCSQFQLPNPCQWAGSCSVVPNAGSNWGLRGLGQQQATELLGRRGQQEDRVTDAHVSLALECGMLLQPPEQAGLGSPERGC